jgi:uncharacterized protein
MFEWWQQVLLAATGLVGGTLGGFLGLGGTVVFMPLLKIISDGGTNTSVDAHTAIAATLVLNVCVGASSTIGHVRAGRVMPSVVKVIAPTSMAAALGGVMLADLFTGPAQLWLWRLFGVLIVYIVATNVYWLLRPRASGEASDFAPPPAPHRWAAGLVGVLTGLASGLLGVGGGAIAVPAQQMFLRMPLRTAIANSAVVVVCTCLAAAPLKQIKLASLGGDLATAWLIIAILAPTAIIGGFAGSHLTHRIPKTYVRIAFVVFMAWTAYEMLAVKGSAA